MKNTKYIFVQLLVVSLFFNSCSSTKTVGNNQWNKVWEDNFNCAELDTTVWSKIPRNKSGWGNYMSFNDSCYDIKNGKLILKALRNYNPADTARYITGGIWSKHKKYFEEGRLEICARLPQTKGAWPAFWMLSDAKWPVGGEIDIMEHLNHDDFSYQTVHSDYTLKLGIKNNPLSHAVAKINVNTYNIYAVELSKDSLSFYINDTKVFIYPRISTDKEGQYPFARPFFLLLDMQWGGNWVGAVCPEALPTQLEIDWVRFYKFKKKVHKYKFLRNAFVGVGI